MSASSMPTAAPSAASASARLAATVDLPTPPLPEATAMMFLIASMRLMPGLELCAMMFVLTSTRACVTPSSASIAWRRAAASCGPWLLAGKPSWILTAALPSATCTDCTALALLTAAPGVASGYSLPRLSRRSCKARLRFRCFWSGRAVSVAGTLRHWSKNARVALPQRARVVDDEAFLDAVGGQLAAQGQQRVYRLLAQA